MVGCAVKLGDRPLQTLDFIGYRGVWLVLYCSPLDKAVGIILLAAGQGGNIRG